MRKLFDAEPQIIPSPFVLINGSEERRLGVGESLPLPTGNYLSSENPITLEVDAQPDHMLLRIAGSDFLRLNAKWGMVANGFGNNEKKFRSTLSENAFTPVNSGIKCIIGSCLHFDEDNLRLFGDGWILEYRPL